MSNCFDGSGELGLPGGVVTQHGVEGGDHFRVPSLLMRFRALATVREWKERLEHQALSRPSHRGSYGLPVATGAVS
jgi:hypothetical protein